MWRQQWAGSLLTVIGYVATLPMRCGPKTATGPTSKGRGRGSGPPLFTPLETALCCTLIVTRTRPLQDACTGWRCRARLSVWSLGARVWLSRRAIYANLSAGDRDMDAGAAAVTWPPAWSSSLLSVHSALVGEQVSLSPRLRACSCSCTSI